MPKQNLKDNLVIDVDLVIKSYNEKNPDKKQIDRKQLAEMLDVNRQLFSDWKGGRTPKIIYMLLKLMEIGACKFEDLLTEKTEEDGTTE